MVKTKNITLDELAAMMLKQFAEFERKMDSQFGIVGGRFNRLETDVKKLKKDVSRLKYDMVDVKKDLLDLKRYQQPTNYILANLVSDVTDLKRVSKDSISYETFKNLEHQVVALK